MDGTSPPREDWKIGVDIGGTFMDFCALEVNSGRLATLKVLTTPDDPGAELTTGLSVLQEQEGLAPEAVTRFVHGTTVGINTVLQRKGAKLAMITNAGFEDVLELARLRMPDMYSLFCHRADPLIPRDRIFGVKARLNAQGEETTAPDAQSVATAIKQALASGAEGIIVSFLHSWRNDAHERLVKRMILEMEPSVFAFSSSEVWPVIREYERSCTAILNGYVHPRVAGYLEALEKRLEQKSIPAKALLTKSNGGVMSARDGRENCVSMLLSGTASGVTGAAWLARQAGEDRILTLDIGGTSADIALIIDGAAQFGTGEMIGDFPLYIPSVSVSSIAIGGGSIASVDGHGVLRVGPTSAGSIPGPACYGRGGTDATVTDAMAVCGWLGHSDLAYGQLRMDQSLARNAVGALAKTLGRSVEETAQAILNIALSEMFVEVEKLASREGVDLRDFTLLPFGGGGPMLGAFLAKDLGMGRMIAPRRPGVVSALGGLVADLRGDFIRTVFAPLDGQLGSDLQVLFADLVEEARAWLAKQGHEGAAELNLTAEMRYSGQSYEVEVALKQEWLDSAEDIAQAFHNTHARLYDFADPTGQIEVINLRLAIVGAGPDPDFPVHTAKPCKVEPQKTVPVFTGMACDIPLYQREALPPGAQLKGPAIVSQEDTTLIIPQDCTATVDPMSNIVVRFDGVSND
ncbi:hydantoinase/oxoprolinase family protein [Epibacterium sp. SM1979]|uniref:Hydantoinase/oxoprolinase family protein n=1 Tax=Tritonibacter litoralis TaxID=2662264 RepID=A0A843YDM6_9RHOB|nr:hydantoinase/oxoprolinase family protein [Tritonibacter litoralis]MQQ09156.1 hydantoinase/oxoprolinase family protein [Tritonibacter litoralis]